MQCNVFSTFWHDLFVGGWRAQPLRIGRGSAPRSTRLEIMMACLYTDLPAHCLGFVNTPISRLPTIGPSVAIRTTDYRSIAIRTANFKTTDYRSIAIRTAIFRGTSPKQKPAFQSSILSPSLRSGVYRLRIDYRSTGCDSKPIKIIDPGGVWCASSQHGFLRRLCIRIVRGGEVQQGHDNRVCKCNTMCLMCFKHFSMTCLWETGAPNHSNMGGARPLEAHTLGHKIGMFINMI